ncbi:MAG: hypothetical protein R3F05_10520 [Planctomycetota bacterium]
MGMVTCPRCESSYEIVEGTSTPSAACPTCGACASCGRPGNRHEPPLAARIARVGVVVLASLALGALLAVGQRGKRISIVADSSAAVAQDYQESPPADARAWGSLRLRVGALSMDAQRDPLLRPLLRGWVGTEAGRDDEVAHNLLGDVEFHLGTRDRDLFMDLREEELPEIATIQAAREKRWFAPDELMQLAETHDATRQLRAWAEQQADDPAARAVASYRAYVEHHDFYGSFDPDVVWEPPFLTFIAGPPRGFAEDPEMGPLERRRRRELARVAPGILAAVRSEFDRLFGAPLGLVDLMAPYGGRPDYPIGVRSFADGHVVGLWLLDSRRALEAKNVRFALETITSAGAFAYQMDPAVSWPSRVEDPEPVAVARRRLAHAAARALLSASARQHNSWRLPRAWDSAVVEGVAALLECVVQADDGRWHIEPRNDELLLEARALRDRRAKRMNADEREHGGLIYPLLSLDVLLRAAGSHHVADLAAARFDLPRGENYLVFRQQAWMFLHFLRTIDDGALWPRYLQLVRAWMQLPRGESLGFAVDDVFSHGELEVLEDRWADFVRDLLSPLPEQPAAGDGK